MLIGTECKKLLNGLVIQGGDSGTDKNSNNQLKMYDAELALFTTLPSPPNGLGGVEVSLPGYSRRLIKGKCLDDETYMFGNTAAWNTTLNAYKITNTGSIQFHAIDEDAIDTEYVLGFGIYARESTSVSEEKRLVLWGPLIDDNGDPVVANDTAPVLGAGSVPIFLEEDFTILFESLNSSGLSSNICINYLNTLVNYHTSGTSYQQTYTLNTQYACLGLFTTLPNVQGNNGIEIPTVLPNSETLTGYARKALWGNAPTSIYNKKQFDREAQYLGGLGKYKIENTEEIQMHSLSRNLPTTYTVKGFGIWAGAAGSSAVLIAWGPLVDTSGNIITVDANFPVLRDGSVPIFYAYKFKLYLSTGETPGIPLNSITLDSTPTSDQHNLSTIDARIQLEATFNPSTVSDKSIIWRSSNDNIARVDEDGLVMPSISTGTTSIIAYATDEKTATYSVTSNAIRPVELTFGNEEHASILITSKTVKRYTSSGAPSDPQYKAIVYIQYPSGMAAANKEITVSFEDPDKYHAIPSDSDYANGKIVFYSTDTAFSSTKLKVSLVNDPTVEGELDINTTN